MQKQVKDNQAVNTTIYLEIRRWSGETKGASKVDNGSGMRWDEKCNKESNAGGTMQMITQLDLLEPKKDESIPRC